MRNDLENIGEVLAPLIDRGYRIFSVAGCGGKTTFIRRGALYYGQRLRVGVAASTKMYRPDGTWQLNGRIPEVVTPGRSVRPDGAGASICFYAEQILPNGKLSGIGAALLRLAQKNSDLIFIEADGSAGKPLKGWRSDEPVIPPATDVTVGILPMHCLGRRLQEDMVHRLDIFSDITGLTVGDVMNMEAYRRLIMHPAGLFGHASGERLLVLNRAGDERLWQAAEELAGLCRPYVSRSVIGCLMNE